jgi:membrane-bound lytic murein transglycosylase D
MNPHGVRTRLLRQAHRPVVLLLAAGLLAACAHHPVAPPVAPTPLPFVRLPELAPPPEPVATLLPATEVAGEAEAEVAPAAPTAVVTPDAKAAAYPDIFERLRAGYSLPPADERLIGAQLRYFAGRTEFLDRVFERAERYLYYVVTELEARHMPLELAMLPVIESGYNPYAYSRARAAGIWQFIAPTATRYQVRVNWWQDGRRDIQDSTRAALDYLAQLHEQFGDWYLAIAAYNCGEGGVERAIAKNRAKHLPTDFWHLKLPRETHGYVPSLLAMARLVGDPAAYGLAFTPIANRPFFARVNVGTQIDLRVAAALAGVSAEELHALNPAFNRWATDPAGPYHLLVPYDAAPAFSNVVATLSTEARMPLERHRMEAGDTVASLAVAHDVPVAAIAMLNETEGRSLVVGDDILLPASDVHALRAGLVIEGETPGTFGKRHRHGRVYVVRRGDTLSKIARRNQIAVGELERLNGLGAHSHLTAGRKLVLQGRGEATAAPRRSRRGTSRSADPHQVSYTVQPGDSLARISARFEVSVAQLSSWNRLGDSHLRPGQKLIVHNDKGRDNGG